MSEDVVRVRFDPVEQMPCVIKNLRVFTDTTNYVNIETNAESDGDSYKFTNYDAQIIAILNKTAKWIVFEGNIEYTYDIMSTKTSEIRALKANVLEANFKLDKLKKESAAEKLETNLELDKIKKEFEAEKLEKENLNKIIRELENKLKKKFHENSISGKTVTTEQGNVR